MSTITKYRQLKRPDISLLSENARRLWELIYQYHRGRWAVITAQEIRDKLHLGDIREVTELVYEVRNAGCLLASCPQGYYYPCSRESKEEYLQRERGRVMNQLRTHRLQRSAPCLEEIEELAKQEEGRMF